MKVRFLFPSACFVAIVLDALFWGATAQAADGIVVYNRSGCRSRFVVQTQMGYAILEWYGGSDPSEGHRLVGDYEGYGLKDIRNVTANQSLRVWVEDYWLSQSSVVDKLRRFCN